MVRVSLSVSTSKFEVNLEDEYGIECRWDELSEDEQNEIKDRIREEYVLYVDIEDVD